MPSSFYAVFVFLSLSIETGFSQQTSCTSSTSSKFMSTKTDYELVANKTKYADYEIPSKII